MRELTYVARRTVAWREAPDPVVRSAGEAIVAPVAATGTVAPERVVSHVLDWDDLPDALPEKHLKPVLRPARRVTGALRVQGASVRRAFTWQPGRCRPPFGNGRDPRLAQSALPCLPGRTPCPKYALPEGVVDAPRSASP
ncbi:hypothetical protein [Streptomyces sp. SKN60]|uniref:hypothetical protein n=1 Tax=Streptomyces sp. SKN60 TaxID=2855506 RepID=UPI002245E9E9|nr:hypothetical protein [Streptomyces sp. SKN60]